jgi:hypothetical protein
MRAPHENLHSADVVAVFDSQDAADEAILQLRLNKFPDGQIGYFMWHPTAGLTDLYDRSYAGAGVVVGSVVGAALGYGAAWLLNQWSVVAADVSDFFGLAVTCATVAAMFGGFIGWMIGVEIHRRGIEAPNVDPAVGPYIIAVHAGDAQERAWGIIHRYGGHELPPGAMMAHPSAV